MASPYWSTQLQTRSTNLSLPSSCRVMPSAASMRSTTTWVAIPAWSVPGRYRLGSPFILCHRTIRSCSAVVSACPMCSSPVTLGGGMMTVKGVFERSISGVKWPSRVQASYIRGSTDLGSYALGMSRPALVWVMCSSRGPACPGVDPF